MKVKLSYNKHGYVKVYNGQNVIYVFSNKWTEVADDLEHLFLSKEFVIQDKVVNEPVVAEEKKIPENNRPRQKPGSVVSSIVKKIKGK